MTRKYICDNCGKEVEKKNLFQLSAFNVEDSDDDRDLGEVCTECLDKLVKFVKEGFQ